MSDPKAGLWEQRRDMLEDRGWEPTTRTVNGIVMTCAAPECKFCASMLARHRFMRLEEVKT